MSLPVFPFPRVNVRIEGAQLQQTGPLLITHWGFSGPAVLKLSAWGARFLHEKQYKAEIKVNWLPDLNEEQIKAVLMKMRQEQAPRMMATESPFGSPKTYGRPFF